jgi:hypothetical protein
MHALRTRLASRMEHPYRVRSESKGREKSYFYRITTVHWLGLESVRGLLGYAYRRSNLAYYVGSGN